MKIMAKFNFNKTSLEGVYIVELTSFGDERGYFMETYNQKEFEKKGLDMIFVQDNQSKSKQGVLRGLHFQTKHQQGKLVRVISGEVFDVAVDLRKGSPTYGQWEGVILTAENKKQFYIPEGFAHGFLVLSEHAEFVYKCTDFYHPEYEGGIPWDDPTIGVQWPLDNIEKILLSTKDEKWEVLKKQKIEL